MVSFDQLDLPEALRKALVKMNFQTPTPIQAKSIPLALEGRDLIGSAQTGTGKTAAFSLPMLKHLLTDEKSVALVLVPTRELAEQVFKVVKELSAFAPQMRSALIIGGVSQKAQIQALRNYPRVIIATPGRLIDHLGQKNAALSNVRFLVLDEADRMLDMGFAAQLERIARQLPAERQTMLFSATLPPNILALSKKYLNNPAQVAVGEANQAATSVAQKVLKVAADKKNDALLDEVNARTGSMLVFVRTKSRVERVTKYLVSYGVAVERIHGNRSQAQRTKAISSLRSGEIRVLVATDIAARGLDVSQVAHVINYDLPMDPEDYVHRIGRTGRAGRTGDALSFVTNEDRETWTAIQRLLSKSSKDAPLVEVQNHPDFSESSGGGSRAREERQGRGGGRAQGGGRREGGREGGRPAGRGGPRGSFARGQAPRSGSGPRRDGRSERPERSMRAERPEHDKPTRVERSGRPDGRSERAPSFGGRKERDASFRDERGARRDERSERPASRGERSARPAAGGPDRKITKRREDGDDTRESKKESKIGQFFGRFGKRGTEKRSSHR